jgi:hypothetical protein
MWVVELLPSGLTDRDEDSPRFFGPFADADSALAFLVSSAHEGTTHQVEPRENLPAFRVTLAVDSEVTVYLSAANADEAGRLAKLDLHNLVRHDGKTTTKYLHKEVDTVEEVAEWPAKGA